MSMLRMLWVHRRMATHIVFWNTKSRYWTVSPVMRDYAGEKLEGKHLQQIALCCPTFVG